MVSEKAVGAHNETTVAENWRALTGADAVSQWVTDVLNTLSGTSLEEAKEYGRQISCGMAALEQPTSSTSEETCDTSRVFQALQAIKRAGSVALLGTFLKMLSLAQFTLTATS